MISVKGRARKMKRERKIVPFIILILLAFVSCSFAQEKRYPPYPDVWERESVDYLGEPTFIPATDGEVIIKQHVKVDKNGSVLRDKRGNTLKLNRFFLFFEIKTVDNFKREVDWRIDKSATWDIGLNKDYFDLIHSCRSTNFSSKGIALSDGTKIRWIKGLVVDRWSAYGEKGRFEKKEVDDILIDYQYEYPVNFSSHITYYNKPIILEKVDKDGRVLWQKVYLYFHPWWGNKTPRFMETKYDDFYSFYYFKLGCVATIDEDRMFLYFDGTKKIFRLGGDGNPRTEDKNLIVMDYKEYRPFIKQLISKVDNINDEERRKGKKGIQCRIQMKERGRFFTISDYDYLGEKIGRKLGISIDNKEVDKIMGEFRGLDRCVNDYKRMENIQ